MEKLKSVIEMLQESIYNEFTQNEWRTINVDEVGKVADFLKDFTMAIYYWKECCGEDTESGELTADELFYKLQAKASNLGTTEKSALKHKLSMMIQSMA